MNDFRMGTVATALLLASAVATGAGAQGTASAAPWRAFLGCWSAGAVTPVGLDASQPTVCVSPTASANEVQVTTIADGKVVSSQRVDASGREVPLTAKDCTGTQVGRWSADGRRVYLTATATCDGVQRTTSGILAITATGEWLDVQGVKADGAENVRVARYRDIGVRGTVPAEIAESLRDGGMAVSSARIAAGADIGASAVVEASKVAGVPVTEAFILERGQAFSLDARQLVALADAGVSTRLTDAMIAVSNPRTFAVRPARLATDTLGNDAAGRRVYVMLDRYSPYGWGYSPYGSRYGYDAYGYDRYGYSSYGGRYYPGYTYYGGPVIIVRGDGVAEREHGRVVKGGGYERPGAAEASGTARRRGSRETEAPSRSTGSSSSGSSSSGGSSPSAGSSSSSGSSSSNSSDRTAKPRP